MPSPLPCLTLRGRAYSVEALRAWQPESAPADLTENERTALAFCQRWLSGADRFVVHTSGSTGPPQAIALSRRQMEASAQATAEALGLTTGMAALVCLPARYIAGQMMLVRGLMLGLAMTLVEPAADPFGPLPADAAFDFTALVPLQLQTLLEGPPDYRRRLNRMRAILVGGAAVSHELERLAQAVAAPIYHTYGMTETASHVALRRLNGPDASPWFRPLPGVEIAVDERGCLRVRGPMTEGRWVQTNDRVELAPSEEPFGASPFRWLGRWDLVINSGGVKVPVETVEAAVAAAWTALDLPRRRFLVGGMPDPRLGEAVTLVIEGEPLAAEQEAALRSALGRRLERFHQPRRIAYLPRLAETETGKPDRRRSLALCRPS
ncbi:MAG: AMP-binding protein [Anaerolineae bacterium]|nr:AMP-binding protein [Anaerolineae bacterium]